MVMPREVSLALRGPDAHVSLPAPPAVPTTPVDAAAVDREAALAARAAVDSVDRLLACADTGTVALRKDGMVGVREVRRLAREIGGNPAELRFWLEVAYDADLFGQVDGVLAPTGRADAWRAAEPADRYAALARTWWDAETPLEAEEGGPLDLTPIGGHRGVRRATLRAVAGLDGAPESTADPFADPFADLVAWHAPIAGVEEEPRAVGAAWREAGLLGLVAHGAASALGRGLLDGDVAGPARRLLPAAVDTVTFQADLTAVVAGTPSARIADLLGRVADVEARGTASTWRFSPGSVRRAMDAGAGADDLVAELAAVATAPLPQPLEYLIRDTGRRHGQVQVRRAMCCVCADDPALLAEIAGHRKLAALGLVQLAPTVLACATPLEDALAALRAAGYAPVGREAGGAAVVERVARRRADGHGSGGPADRDLMALAVEVREGRPRRRPELPRGLVEATPRLSQEERQAIARALADHTTVWIEYLNREGNRTKRVVEPTALDLPFLEAWCHLRDDERVFHLGRIQAVWPAGT
jgi:Helicase conserved C-terminal domain/WYL domain